MLNMKVNGRRVGHPARYRQGVSTPAQRGLNAGHCRISKHRFTELGGLSNPKLFRRMRGVAWTYWSAA